VNLVDLERFANGTTVDAAALIEAGLVPDEYWPVKILGEGEFKKKLTVVAGKFSKSAYDKITKAGGTAQNLKGEPFAFPRSKEEFVPRDPVKKAKKGKKRRPKPKPSPPPKRRKRNKRSRKIPIARYTGKSDVQERFSTSFESRTAEQGALHPVHAGDLSHRVSRADSGRRSAALQELQERQSTDTPRGGDWRSTSRCSPAAACRRARSSARRDAVHLGVDHLPAAASVVPALEKLQKEGETGRKKIQEWTRYAPCRCAWSRRCSG
jgi:hypothetical protein